ncbi:MAG TPA: DUF4382 domain-containing protein [Candidatus Polarisedimenticolaceae bacterium]|nr:DUF4382 domain-containing protein [Candidatus Polarisedimenticolaceae bacterium]
MRIRTAVCAVALATLVAGGCADSGSMTGTGKTGRVHLTMGGSTTQAMTAASMTMGDGSGRTITAATITVSAIEARNLDGQLVPVTVTLPMDVDLVALMNGGTTSFPDGALPVGTYDQIVVVIRALHVTLSDGTVIDVTPPGGGWTSIVPADQFDVVAGQTTSVQLHFQPTGAFQWNDGQLVFNPGFDCSVDHHHGDD